MTEPIYGVLSGFSLSLYRWPNRKPTRDNQEYDEDMQLTTLITRTLWRWKEILQEQSDQKEKNE